MSVLSDRQIERRESPESLPTWARELPPPLGRIYLNRGIDQPQLLQHNLSDLPSPQTLKGLDAALQLLTTALQQQQRIIIVGDFDADGATSTALAVRALKAFGARHVDFLVPNRFEFGYGLTPEIVAVAGERKPDLLITVDNGISSLKGVEAAQQLGMKVLVTDHHLPGDELPGAEAIINPNQPGDEFPDKGLAGVGVIFYLMLALRGELRRIDWFESSGLSEPNLAELLDLVALGTVADVVPLGRTNRILVSQGLARMRSGQTSTGLATLIRVSGREAEFLSSADLGFAIGPRLNAAGRMDDMSVGIRLLLCDSEQEAWQLAVELDNLNAERREIEQSMRDEAFAHLKRLNLEQSDSQRTVCIYRGDWHPGVIGILASRIKEYWHKPTIVFADDSEEQLRGSARSIPNLHIRDVLARIDALEPGLLLRFGGHAMAAGMAIKKDGLERFEALFEQVVREMADPAIFAPVIATDGPLEAEEATLELAHTLRLAMPWGSGFIAPQFDGVFRVVDWRWVGGRHLKMRLSWPDSNKIINAIAFNYPAEQWPEQTQVIKIVYQLDLNIWNGQQMLQLLISHLDPL